MKATVLIVSVNKCRSPYPVFPLGASYIADALLTAGFNTTLIDLSKDDIVQVVKTLKPDFIGLSLRNIDDVRIDNTIFFISELDSLRETIRSLSDAPIILGGSAYSLFPEKLLEQTRADYGIAGEGENSIVALLNILENESNPALEVLRDIPGLYIRKDSLIIRAAVSNQLQSFSYPQRSQELVSSYIKNSSMLNVQSQRGCAFTCCYCTYPLIEGRNFRRRDPVDIVDELVELTTMGAAYFFIVDSVFNTSEQHVRGICEEIIRRNVVIKWGCFLRPLGISLDLMSLMAQAGLSHIEFGSDSFCDSVLEAYQKGFTFSDIYISSEHARTAQVHYSHFLIIGGPSETEETILQSYANGCTLKRTVIFPFVGMRVYPGTSLYKKAVVDGVVDLSTDLFAPFFYLSPLVKKERIDQLLHDFKNQSPNWIIGDTPPEMERVASALRAKGVVGPLWEFLAR